MIRKSKLNKEKIIITFFCAFLWANSAFAAIKIVIFDLGGVVVGLSHHGQASFLRSSLGFPKELTDKDLRIEGDILLRGLIEEEWFWPSFAKGRQGTVPVDWQSTWRSFYLDHAPVNAEVLFIAEELRSNGLRIPILSDTIASHHFINQERGVYNSFSPLYLSHELHLTKSGTEIFQLVLKDLDVLPEECIFIDDSSTNILQAEKVGIKGILYRDSAQLRQDLKDLGLITDLH